MRVHTGFALLSAVGLAVALAVPAGAGGAGKKAEAGVLVVIDHAGKEFKLSGWKFLGGTRPLSWLAPAGKPKGVGEKGGADEVPAGPEALELREEQSTTFLKGILTLIPVASIKKIEYDADSKTVRVTYLKAGAKGAEEGVLSGLTKYKGVNKLALEGETDLGELGKAAVKFQGGTPKTVKSILFPAPKPMPAVTGRPAVITALDNEKTTHQVADLRALYRVGRGQELLSNTLLFKKTVKVDLGKLQKLRQAESEEKGADGYEFELTLKSGKQHTLTLLTKTNPEDGKPAELEGLLGRMPGAYKLFPAHTIAEVQFEPGAAVLKKDAD